MAAHPLQEAVSASLQGWNRLSFDAVGLRPAAVALCLLLDGGVAKLLITRRASRLRSHAGQWALPGGHRDHGESAADAALRELSEETGLSCDSTSVLGQLDDYPTRSGHLITPVVVWAGRAPTSYSYDEAEVASVHLVPLEDLDVTPRFIRIPESDRPVIQLPMFGRFVHAPMAAIIYQFCRVALHGESVRVAHFEQPVFAWR